MDNQIAGTAPSEPAGGAQHAGKLLVDDFVPAREGGAWMVKRGQRMRIRCRGRRDLRLRLLQR